MNEGMNEEVMRSMVDSQCHTRKRNHETCFFVHILTHIHTHTHTSTVLQH
jgi:hypothetical protein